MTSWAATQRIGLDRVDDMNRVAIIAQMGIERQPVVACRFHTEHNRLAETAHHVHEFVVTRLGIGKAHGLADNTSILSDYPRLRIASKTYVKINSFHFVGKPPSGVARICEDCLNAF